MFKTLVSADTLNTQLDNPDWVVFDCRFQLDQPDWGEQVFGESHIPGARYAHLDRDMAAPKSPETGRHPLPDAETFAQWLGRNGVDVGRQVVAYDQGGGALAARLWWMLRWLGHDAVAVLDGGWAAWTGAGYPVDDGIPEPEPVTFKAIVRDNLWLTSEQLETALETRRVRLIDARGAERFSGDSESIDPVAGHVPGAANLPFAGNLDEQGRFKSPDVLKARFAPVVAAFPGDHVVHMCGSGVTACHNLLAMEVAGLKDSRLYPGSWSEWITDPKRKVEKGR